MLNKIFAAVVMVGASVSAAMADPNGLWLANDGAHIGIAACGNCVDLIEHTDIPTVLDLGYLVDARSPTSVTAMLWRQHRWAYLDIRGRIHAVESALSNRAC